MENFRLQTTITLDLNNKDEVARLIEKLSCLLVDGKVVNMPVKAEPEKTEKKPATGKKDKPKNDEPKKEATQEAEEETSGEGATLDVIRTLIADKVDSNRDAIRDKLKSYGTKNATNLDPKHYTEFHEFLTGLK